MAVKTSCFLVLLFALLVHSEAQSKTCECTGFIRRQRIFGRNAGTRWSSVALQILEEVNNDPATTLDVPPVGRTLAVFSACMYDTFCALSGECRPVLFNSSEENLSLPASPSRREISDQVSFAAFTALESLFGRTFSQAKRQLQSDGLDQDDVSGSVGNAICDSVIEARADDGSSDTISFDPRQTNEDSRITFDAECRGRFTDLDGWQPLCIPPPEENVQLPTFPQQGPVVSSSSARQLNPRRNASHLSFASRQVSEGSDDNGENRLPSLAAAAEDANDCNPQDFPTPQYGVSVVPFAPETRTLAENLAAPPQAGSERFDSEFNEVLEISGTLDDRLKTVAEYWDDNPFRTFPPGQWYRVSLEAAVANGISLKNTLALQMTMGFAQLDAGIAAWTTKYNENLVRPITVIQCNKKGENLTAWSRPYLGVREFTQTGNETWRPFLETPPFPGYVSGHSTFGGAGEAVLKSFFGDRYVGPNCFRRRRGRSELEPRITEGRPGFQDGVTDVANSGPRTVGFSPARTVELCWKTFTEASEENGLSRLIGGVHIKADNEFGLSLGREVGEAVDRLARTFTGIAEGGGEQA